MLADGRLAGGGENGTIKLWPTEGRNSATAQERGCAAGEPLVLSPGSSNNDFEAVQSLAVLADGWLASGGEDGLVKLWSTKFTGEPVVLSGLGSPGHELKGHGLGSGVSSLAVLPDGRLVSAGFDGAIKLWMVNEQKLIAALCLRAGRNLTKGEWARYLGRETPWQPSCRSFGVPSNWRTIDEHKSGAPALDNAPAEAGSAALPASSAPSAPPTSEKGIVNLSRGGALSRLRTTAASCSLTGQYQAAATAPFHCRVASARSFPRQQFWIAALYDARRVPLYLREQTRGSRKRSERSVIWRLC